MAPFPLVAIPDATDFNPAEKKHPQLRLILSEELNDSLIKRLHNHEIDAALLATPTDEQDFVNIPLLDETFWVAYPREHHFYNREKNHSAGPRE